MSSHRKTKEILTTLVDKTRDALKLNEWRIEHRFMSGKYPEGADTLMSVKVDISYLRATIWVWESAYTAPLEELKHAYVHEMCHIYTEGLYSIARAGASPHLHDFIEEQREQLTERIARLVSHTL